MKITLKKLVLVNFKGIKSMEIDFAEETIISGRNATGKNADQPESAQTTDDTDSTNEFSCQSDEKCHVSG